MDMSTWPKSEAKQLVEEIDRLDLHRNVFELDTLGLTVVDASKTQAAPLADRAFERICELIEERTGTRPDVETGSTHVDVVVPSLYHVIFDDPVFEQLLMHPLALALATYLVGRRCTYSGSEVFMKGPADRKTGNALGIGASSEGLQLGLHSDNVVFPEPFAPYAQLCNVTWLLSDYTKEAGALAFVPGSHKLCRNPHDGEAAEQAVPIEAPKGSLVVWHANTWHGSFPRLHPGLRTSLAFALAREYARPHEPDRSALTPEMLERNDRRFARLMGCDVLEWGQEGPDYDKLMRRPFRVSTMT